MAQVQHNGFIFVIPDAVQTQYSELVKLVLSTESMDNSEKQYWFDILPSMTSAQVDRLFDILETERRKLEELELKYQDELKRINEKHLIEWQEFQNRSNKQKIQQAEAADTQGKQADDILASLNSL